MGHVKSNGKHWKYPALVYRRHAFCHVGQAFVVLSAVSVGLGAILAGVIVLVVGEMLLVGVMPRIPVFRRAVDVELDQLERSAAAATHATIVVRMSDADCRELKELERLVARVRTRLTRGALDSNVEG